MRYSLTKGCGLPLPRLAGTLALCRADAVALRVLICLAQTENADSEQLSVAADCTSEEAENALLFWKRQRVIKALEDEENAASTDIPTDIRVSEIMRLYADVIGKADVNVNEYQLSDLREMLDKYEVDYIASLVKYFGDVKGKAFSFSYIKTVAKDFWERGIKTAEDFDRYIEQRTGVAGEARRLFGIGSTAFSENQSRLIDKWTMELGYGVEIFGLAYDIMAEQASRRSFSYLDKILTRWHDGGCKTADDVRALIDKESKDRAATHKPTAPRKNGANFTNTSFDPKSAFQKALKRSAKLVGNYEEDK